MTRPADQAFRRHELGFLQLDPLPDEASLRAFYGDDYYADLEENPRRGPDLERLKSTDGRAEAERAWLESTLYTDVRHYLSELGLRPGSMVDVGCGTGDFVASMTAAGWQATGTELSGDAVHLGRSRGLQVLRTDLQSFVADADPVDVVAMFNVLEHVRDPISELHAAHALLQPGGCLVVQVPNDFSVLQAAGVEYCGVDPWWIAVPDHLNYFSYDSLEATLRATGFEPVVRTGSFAMELFLLMGQDYITHPELGVVAHQQRKELETTLSPQTRRAMAEAMAAGGIGRNCLVVSVRP